MFTGIVDHTGTVASVEKLGGSCRFAIQCEFTDLVEGESIAVDGACLTVICPKPHSFECELSPETLAKTTASQFLPGTRVNLERALRLSDRLGGHLVMGHVDQTGTILKRSEIDGFVHFFLGGIYPEGVRYLIPKGSIAMNGVSLTINAVRAEGVELMIIPHTLERTNLNQLHVDSQVNLEFDWMIKVVLGEAERLKLLDISRPLL